MCFLFKVFLKITFIETFCVRDCDPDEFKEVCAIRPHTHKKVVIKNMCLLERQMCYDAEFKCGTLKFLFPFTLILKIVNFFAETYKFLHDKACEGWDGWTIEEVGKNPCPWSSQ